MVTRFDAIGASELRIWSETRSSLCKVLATTADVDNLLGSGNIPEEAAAPASTDSAQLAFSINDKVGLPDAVTEFVEDASETFS